MKVLKFLPILDHPVTRPYPWPAFTPLVALLSCVVIAGLTVLNVATQGYEAITVVQSDFSQSNEWLPSFGKGSTTCQPHQFLPGDELRTNVSLLRYSISSITGELPSSDNFSILVDVTGQGFDYSGAVLQDLCPGWKGAILSVELDARARTVIGTIQVPCALDLNFVNSSTGTLQLLARHTADTFTITFSPATDTRDLSIWPRMDMALSGLAGDLLIAVLSTPGLDRLRATGWMYCPAFQPPDRTRADSHSSQDEANCAAQPSYLYVDSIDTLYANNTLISPKFNATSPALQQSVANYFQLLNAAGQGDMGIWAAGNLLLSQTMLNATVSANAPVSALLAASPYLAWSGGDATAANISAASHLRATGLQDVGVWSLPVPQNQTTPAVFAVSYLCVGRKLKPLSTLLISVFVADASMFTVFWSFLMIGAAMLARRGGSAGRFAPCTFLAADFFPGV
ncbi:hypothetical protein DFH09DRAFT_159682 [Mycena vulgaris]|nr:hypothetical protein DFH09DRAFT_159682 [Mycena vulgaris]